MTKEDVPFRAMLAHTTFKKTGRAPDVEFFESEYFQKAANEADFDEMAENYSAQNRKKEIQDTLANRTSALQTEDYLQDGFPTNADYKAYDAHQKKELKPVGRVVQREIQRAIPDIQQDIQEYGSDYADLAPVMHTEGHWARDRAMDKLIAEGNPENMKNFSYSNDLYDYLRTAATNIFSKRLNLSGEDLDDLVGEFMNTLDGDSMDLYLKQIKK